jgi:hypothetical protein
MAGEVRGDEGKKEEREREGEGKMVGWLVGGAGREEAEEGLLGKMGRAAQHDAEVWMESVALQLPRSLQPGLAGNRPLPRQRHACRPLLPLPCWRACVAAQTNILSLIHQLRAWPAFLGKFPWPGI